MNWILRKARMNAPKNSGIQVVVVVVVIVANVVVVAVVWVHMNIIFHSCSLFVSRNRQKIEFLQI